MFSVLVPKTSSESEASVSWYVRNKALVIMISGASAVLLVVGIIVSYVFSSAETPVNVMNSVQLNQQVGGNAGVQSVRSINVRDAYPTIVALAIKHWPITAAIAAAVLFIIIVVAVLLMRSGEVLEELEDPKKNEAVVQVEELWWEDPFNLALAAVGSVVFLWLCTKLFSGNRGPVVTTPVKTAEQLENESMAYFDDFIGQDNPANDVKSLRTAYLVAVWSRYASRLCPPTDPNDINALQILGGLPVPTANPDQVSVYDSSTSAVNGLDASLQQARTDLRDNLQRIAGIMAEGKRSIATHPNIATKCTDERPNISFANLAQWNTWLNNVDPLIKAAPLNP